jgi:hypothetical protein
MDNYAFIFAHGWGSNQYFWQNLQPLIAKNNFYICDFGYFRDLSKNNKEDLKVFVETNKSFNRKIIGIGHSLGFSKLLSIVDCDYYFGLQTFVSFFGKNNKIVKQNFLNYSDEFVKNPFECFKSNYSYPEVREYFKNLNFNYDNINFDNLFFDLKLLSREFEDLSLLFEKLNVSEYHIIASKHDAVVPLFIAKDNFPDNMITVVEESFHSLGLLHAELVQNIIFDKLKLF